MADHPSKLYQVMMLLDDVGVGGSDVVEQVRHLIAENERLAAMARAEATRPDLERMLLALEADPTDALLPIADACLDAGRDDLARGWGWLAMTRRWPARNYRNRWFWSWADGTKTAWPFIAHMMPPGLQPIAMFETPRHALEFVALAIAEGRWVPPTMTEQQEGAE